MGLGGGGWGTGVGMEVGKRWVDVTIARVSHTMASSSCEVWNLTTVSPVLATGMGVSVSVRVSVRVSE